MNTFKQDLEFGNKWEDIFLSHIDYDEFEKAPAEKFTLWDIKTIKNGITTTWEIKTDRRSHLTKNVCIEFESYGSKSGIQTSKANNWVYISLDDLGGYDIYIIPRKQLIKMCNNQEYKRIGKTINSNFFLFDIDLFKKYLYKSVW